MTGRPRRTDEERLQLFLRQCDVLSASSVVQGGTLFRFEMGWEASTMTLRTSLAKPEFEALQAFVVAVRDFDNPKDDLFVPGIVAILRPRLDAEHLPFLDQAADAFDRLRESNNYVVKLEGEEGPSLRPRDAFDRWAYAEQLHHDFEKERQMQALPGPVAQGVRACALEYLADLVENVSYLSGFVRFARREGVEA